MGTSDARKPANRHKWAAWLRSLATQLKNGADPYRVAMMLEGLANQIDPKTK